MSPSQQIPPRPTPDRDSLDWWERLRSHELWLQSCETCGKRRWPAREICSSCSSFLSQWSKLTGRGTVASWVVNHHALVPGFEPGYVVVTVRLDEQEDLLLIGGFVGDTEALHINMPVEATYIDYEPADDGSFTLLFWRPTHS